MSFPGYDVVDLFAGPGGWDVGLGLISDLRIVGIEWEHAACETRRAAGHATIEGDIRDFGPADFPDAFALIASPSCQSFSMAGKGAGRQALSDVLAHIDVIATTGRRLDTDSFGDPRTGLVLEPLWWVAQARALGRPYRWLAFEQVSPVLPVWQAYATVLEGWGYHAAVGILSAEQYGVPQTRKRAVLLASLDHEVFLPEPTHSKFYPRTPDKLDPGVKPWVSMAQALGWAEPSKVGRNAAEQGRGSDAPFLAANPRPRYGQDHQARLTAQPSSAVTPHTSKARLFDIEHVEDLDKSVVYVGGNQPHAARRRASTPAPTIHFGARLNEVNWIYERPSTPIQGDPRVAAPGRRERAAGERQFDARTVKVSVAEASVLQTFGPDYPWAGTKTKQFEQVGNAVPPVLAAALLGAVL